MSPRTNVRAKFQVYLKIQVSQTAHIYLSVFNTQWLSRPTCLSSRQLMTYMYAVTIKFPAKISFNTVVLYTELTSASLKIFVMELSGAPARSASAWKRLVCVSNVLPPCQAPRRSTQATSCETQPASTCFRRLVRPTNLNATKSGL